MQLSIPGIQFFDQYLLNSFISGMLEILFLGILRGKDIRQFKLTLGTYGKDFFLEITYVLGIQ